MEDAFEELAVNVQSRASLLNIEFQELQRTLAARAKRKLQHEKKGPKKIAEHGKEDEKQKKKQKKKKTKAKKTKSKAKSNPKSNPQPAASHTEL